MTGESSGEINTESKVRADIANTGWEPGEVPGSVIRSFHLLPVIRNGFPKFAQNSPSVKKMK